MARLEGKRTGGGKGGGFWSRKWILAPDEPLREESGDADSAVSKNDREAFSA